jgi:hypothetical protein
MVDLQTKIDIEAVLAAYLECALWSSCGEGGEPLEAEFGVTDFSIAARAAARDDCLDFIGLCAREGIDLSKLPANQVGFDFWLTRNHHGAGFWDRGLGRMGEDLTKWAHAAGSCDVYVSDADELEFL